jgi:hypothetical protein
MRLSPLAERIYQTLVRQLRLASPLIAYGDLVRALGPLPPPDANLKANDYRLFEALEEISRACQGYEPPLPALTSIVVRRREDGSLGEPGRGYFAVTFPEVQEERERLRLWREELRRVVASSYPEELASVASSRPDRPRQFPRWLREPTVIAAIIGLAGTLLAVIIPMWISSRRDEPSRPRQADRVVVTIVPKDDAPQKRQAGPPEEETTSRKLTLDGVLDILGRHRQRATFGAVAGILGREPRSLFNGYARTPKTAWVVNKTTGLPTGTNESDFPDGLLQNKRVIDAPDELRAWLQEHH